MEDFIPWNRRIELLHLALREEIHIRKKDDVIRVDEETKVIYDDTHKPTIENRTASLQFFLDEWMKRRNDSRHIDVYIVGGTDMFELCRMWHWDDDVRPPFICIAAEGTSPPIPLSKEEQIRTKRILVSTPKCRDIHSTEINRRLANGEMLSDDDIHHSVFQKLMEWKRSIAPTTDAAFN